MIENLPKQAKKHLKEITNFVWGSIQYYYEHDCYKKLKAKVSKLNDSIDMRFSTKTNTNNRIQNAWRSNIAYPMSREAFLQQRATLYAAFSIPPIFTILPDGSTPFQNAVNMQDVLLTNCRVNQFIQNPLNQVFNSCSRYGCATVVSYFNATAREVMTTQAQMVNGNFIGYERVARQKVKKGVVAEAFDILNYFQQPDQPDPFKARYRGYVERVPLHEILNDYEEDPDFYIKDNLLKITKNAEKGSVKSQHYRSAGGESETPEMIYVDRYHWFGTLDFKGNRDDGRMYYVQLIDDTVIAIDYNPNDEELVPIDIYRLDPRPEYWWGSTQAENVIPMENALQTIFSMAIDSGLQELHKLVFYDTSTDIDIASINEASKHGGLVPYNRKPGMPTARDIFYEPQFAGVNPNTIGFLTNEMKSAAQRVVSKGDFSHKAVEGGFKDTTATIGNIIDRQGNTLEAYYLSQFAFGLINNIRTMSIILKQRLGNYILVRPNPAQNPAMIAKRLILGDFQPIIVTSLTQNQINRSQRLYNLITAVQNFKGSGDPTWLNYNLSPVVREWSKDVLQNSVDIDQVYPEISPQQHQMMMAQQMGTGMGVMPGAGGQKSLPPLSPQRGLANVA